MDLINRVFSKKTPEQKRAEKVESKSNKMLSTLNDDLNNFTPIEKVKILNDLSKKIKNNLSDEYESHFKKSKELTEAISKINLKS